MRYTKVVSAITSFYVLEAFEASIFHPRWAYALSEEPTNRGEALRCPVCGRYMSMLRWLPPYNIRLSSAAPQKWGDFVWGAGIDSPLVSERFKTAYEQTDLTGILQFRGPVTIVRVGKNRPGALPNILPTYYIVDIERLGPATDPKAERRVYRPGTHVPCDFCQVSEGGWLVLRDRVVVDLSTWKGEDIFFARGGPPQPIVSERFKAFVEQHRFTNCWLIPAEYYAHDSATLGTYVQPRAFALVEDAEFRLQFLGFWKTVLLAKCAITHADRKRIQALWKELECQDAATIVKFLEQALERMRRGCLWFM